MLMELRFDPPAKFATANDQLYELVARDTGCSDFGPRDYEMGLRTVLQGMDYDPRFTETGRRLAWGTVVSVLSARARAVRAMTDNPGFERTAVKKPVVITGIPRTGTTALHKLMAVDPQFEGLQTWLIEAPMPRPPRASWDANPLFLRSVESLKLRFATTPDLKAAHDMVADELEECWGVLCQSFVSNFWTCNWSSATYDSWWQCQDEAASYDYYLRVIKLIGSAEPEKRWLLKNPAHLMNLDLLFGIFPDARVIHTHRDPAKAIPSLCALLAQLFGSLEDSSRGELHAHVQGHRETAKWSKALRQSAPVREAHRSQILDLVHSDFHADPMAMVRRIYQFLDMELSPEVEARMRARVAAAPELSHGVHRYQVSDFGLTEDEIRESFGDYVDRFDLAPKPIR